MGVVEKLIKEAQNLEVSLRVARVQVGLIYTAVQLQNGATGVAYSFLKERGGHRIPEVEKPVEDRKAWELVSKLGAENLTSSALALATINALVRSSSCVEQFEEGDVLERVDIREGDQVCMVGCFLPVMERLKNRSVRVVAVDQKPRPGAQPAERVVSLLPQSDVALITATSIINDTVDPLLNMAEHCREVVILGPSTPMIAQVFRETAAGWLSGVWIQQPDGVFQEIERDFGFRKFRRYVTKVNLRV
jgi:uncharacterized protein (DUF4213/DUF364 family)